MYLLSVEGIAAQTLLKSVKLPSRWQTVYRWGTHWGYLTDGEWMAEKHQYVTHSRDDLGNTFLLERIEPSSLAAPPFTIDDVWKEEIKQDGECTYGNLLTIRGNKSTMEDILAKLSISYSLPDSIEETSSSLLQETQHLPSLHPTPHLSQKEQRNPRIGGEHRYQNPKGGLTNGQRPRQLPSSRPESFQTNGGRPQNGGRGGRGRSS